MAGWREALQSAQALEKGWDSYVADPPNRVAAKNAESFLIVSENGSVKPTVVNPSVVGGIGITFRGENRTAYVEFRNTGTCHVAFLNEPSALSVVRVIQTKKNYADLLDTIGKYLRVSST